MKSQILLLMLILSATLAFGQDATQKPATGKKQGNTVKSGTKKQKKTRTITTNLFTLDLGEPGQKALTSTDSSSKRLSIRSREPLQLRLINGNPFKYKYVINNKLINFFENGGENPIEKVQKVLNQQPVPPSKTVENVLEEEKDSIKEELDTKIFAFAKSRDSLYKMNLRVAGKEYQERINDLDIQRKQLETAPNKVIEYISKVQNSAMILAKTGTPQNAPNGIDDDKKLVYLASTQVRNEAQKILSAIPIFKSDCLASENLDLKKFIRKKDSLYKEFDTVIIYLQRLKQDAVQFDDLGKNQDKYDSMIAEIQTIIPQIATEFSIFDNVKRDNYIPPIDLNGKNIDAVEITLERFEHNSPVAFDKHKYNIWLRGGLKIDISGGVFLTSLVNNEYFTKDTLVSNETRQKIFVREKGHFEFGFGSAVNLSYRSASWINPTLNVGALFTVNQQFQLITGGGIILGKEERLIFSGGLTMGRVTEISEGYKDDGSETYNLGQGSIPTDSVFGFGYYFGITYNFTKSKTQTSGK